MYDVPCTNKLVDVMILAWFVYDLVMALGFFVYWPWAALRGKRPAGWWARTGRMSEAATARLAGSPVLWIHAVSVGEALAIRPLLRELRQRYPAWRLVVTTVTRTGQDVARTLVGSDDVLAYFPLDLPWTMQRFLTRVQPKLFLAVETELWPNCFRALQARGIPMGVINGRVSPSSYRGYRRLRWFLRPLLEQVEWFLMQTPEDATRLTHMGAPAHRVHVVGNLKWDQGEAVSVPTALKHLAMLLQLDQGGTVFVAGSTHPGEEEILLRTFHKVSRDVHRLFCIIAPRHVERAADVCNIVRKYGLEPLRYSQLSRPLACRWLTPSHVIVVDTIGQLRNLYALATVAFVGGSLVPRGGQNLLEPAYAGKPILTGPHVTNFRAVADALKAGGGLRMVHTATELETALRLLLSSDQARHAMGQRARATIQSNQGAVARTLEAVDPALRHWMHPTAPPTTWLCGSRVHHLFQALVHDRVHAFGARLLQRCMGVGARVYGWLLAGWDAAYTRRWLPVHTASVPVVSVGNVTMGGTGKSVCVLWLAQQLRARGVRVAMLSRGYCRSRSANRGAIGVADSVAVPLGDEPTIFQQQVPDVPVFVGRNRVRSARRAVADAQAELLLLDDGFQHRRLARDYDIVTVDAIDAWGNGRLLPRGPLRELPTALARAHCVILTKTNFVSRIRHALAEQIRGMHPTITVGWARHEMAHVRDVATGQQVPVTTLQQTRALALSSIGSPTSFEQLLLRAGLQVGIGAQFPDHHRYRRAEVAQLMARCARAGVRTIITTEKDWVRLASLVEQQPSQAIRWYVLTIRFAVEDADVLVDRLVRLSRR